MIGKWIGKAIRVSDDIGEHHVGAYAAQAAYFFVLSLIPIILLLLTMVQYTPVTKADVMTAVVQVFPSTVDTLITSIVNQVYNQSSTVIPVTIVVALWSAGKGVLSITTGLNAIFVYGSFWGSYPVAFDTLCIWKFDSYFRNISYTGD